MCCKITKHLGTLRCRGKGNVKCTLVTTKEKLNENNIKELVEKAVG
ncbi:MAG: hypothetical protein V8S33_05885 [Intestinibacter bartlettii]